jgi:hypothetical protein
MGPVLQALLAALLVIVSALYAAWRLLSPRRRLWLLERLIPHGAGAGARWRVRLRSALASDAQRGCGGCAASTSLARDVRGARSGHE